MKGLVKLVFYVIASLIVLIVVLWLVVLSKEAFFTKSLEQMRRFETYKPYKFDLNDLLVDPSDPIAFNSTSHTNYYNESNDPTFCKDLRNCIEMNIKGNKQCLITYKVKPGVFFNISIVNDSIISRCPTISIKEELYGGTGRKVCKFKNVSINSEISKLREDNVTLINYEPSIHNCYLPDNLGSYNVLNDIDSINYLYSGRGNESGYYFTNGGTVRIIVTNVSIKKDFDATCSYSLYVCGQSAIAAKDNETSVSVFRKIQDLEEKELYYNETIVWAGAPKENRIDLGWPIVCIVARTIACSIPGLCPVFDLVFNCAHSFPIEYNVYGYNPRTYEFNFNGTYKNKEALIDAIDAGMWEWSKSHYSDKKATKYFQSGYYPDIDNAYFSYSPIDIANISEDPSINFDSGCWNIGYENSNVYDRTKLEMNYDIFTSSNSLYHNFNFDSFNIHNRIRMVLGIKKIFITKKQITFDIPWWLWPPFGWSITTSVLEQVNNKYKLDLDPRVILVMDPVTFCSG